MKPRSGTVDGRADVQATAGLEHPGQRCRQNQNRRADPRDDRQAPALAPQRLLVRLDQPFMPVH